MQSLWTGLTWTFFDPSPPQFVHVVTECPLNQIAKKEKNLFLVKYRGPILHVTSLAIGSDDLTLDQSVTSIQIILPESAGHVTQFHKIMTLSLREMELTHDRFLKSSHYSAHCRG